MFLPDHIPITCDLPTDLPYADLYFLHDIHFGSELFDENRWQRLKKQIMQNERAHVCWVGDILENAIPGGKSDMFTQKYSPAIQKEWATTQFIDLGNKTMVVVPGNHCYNRTTKASGLYPLYDCCLLAGIGDKYRNVMAFLDIAIGKYQGKNNKKNHYFGQLQHKAKDLKTVHSADYTDGIDFFAFGHDHSPADKPRAKLVFDHQNKVVYKRNVECINCGSFCTYGGYGATNAYRPQSDKMYMLRIFSGEKTMQSIGFYP